MNQKGVKTTMVAIIGLLLGVTTFLLWFLGKVDNEGLAMGLAGVATFTATLGLLFAKDADKSHSHHKEENHD